jgi:hypothetical protein
MVGEDATVDLAFLLGYIALVGLAYARARSTAWLVITLAGATAFAGAAIALLTYEGFTFTRVGLQWLLLAVLAVVAVLAWVPALGFSTRAAGTALGRGGDLGWRRQALGVWLPVLFVLLAFVVMSTWWTEEPAFLRPVSFLIGNGDAEDNAKWLDFTAKFAAGGPIDQAVPMGGPLALLMTFIGTVMGVVSQFVFGGYNEVAVAANMVVYGEFIMVAVVLLAFAPLVESRFRGSTLPLPTVWVAMVALAASALVLVAFGHLTLQFTILVTVLWSVTFLSSLRMRRARLLTSLLVAASMTVWLPLNAVALVVLVGWLAVFAGRAVRSGWRSVDLLGAVLTVLVLIGMWEPIRSSLVYSFAISAGETIGGAVRGVVAAGVLLPAGLVDSPVFGAQGGTEQVGPILAVVTAASVLAAALWLRPVAGPFATSLVRRFAPLALLGVSALGIYLLDFWSTGEGPHYGSLKFTYLVAIVALAATLPLALMLIDSGTARMTQTRWIAIGGVLVLLTIDSLLPRAISQARPQQWSPPIPFDNTSGSYWYPADVNGTATQPITESPVACVYLPEGSAFPTAIVPSGLSDAQRVYSCTRQLAGLAGADATALPLVEWLRREWLTNTPAWTDVYDSLAAMPPEVLAKPVIILDDGSNVIGLESMVSLLQRFPKPAP